MNIEQHAAEIASMYTVKELALLLSVLRRQVRRRETVLNRRLPEYVLRVAKVDQPIKFKLGPVSAAELVAMTARGE